MYYLCEEILIFNFFLIINLNKNKKINYKKNGIQIQKRISRFS